MPKKICGVTALRQQSQENRPVRVGILAHDEIASHGHDVDPIPGEWTTGWCERTVARWYGLQMSGSRSPFLDNETRASVQPPDVKRQVGEDTKIELDHPPDGTVASRHFAGRNRNLLERGDPLVGVHVQDVRAGGPHHQRRRPTDKTPCCHLR